ncbi:MAG TPA: cysteine--tRNA ligase [Candidatus Babeliales bacterium]|jgi:cysteinyl-tRNA synthetase|nr:cysteine--tRNA ligase [Candidatus Babeliales bacterium]
MQFTNTLSGKKEKFATSKPVKMYVCGVTPYDDAHIGHGRCYVAFDLLLRMLRFFGHEVNYCRNFTDIDDKTMHRAEKEFGDRLRFHEIADRYIANFHQDIAKLNCVPPNHEPRVTENIPQIIEFIQNLITQGYAYQSDSDVYFLIEKFPSYGKLSKQKIEDLYVGVRHEACDKKRHPLDFALWKGEPEGEFWKSPWGYGRPGWHIECSVLAYLNLGEHIDIHGGGLDLIFPHHENEIAQSESLLGAPFSRMWIHNGMVNSNKEKMSKSLGNFFVLRDIYKHFDPMVLRYYFLIHHYRMPIEFSFEGLTSAQKSYEKLIRLFAGDLSDDLSFVASAKEEAWGKSDATYQSDLSDRIKTFLQDDLNTPGLFGVIFEHSVDIANNKHELAAVKNILVNILGLTLQPLPENSVALTPEIEELIVERNKARREKNWARADELRDQLKMLGVDVHDGKM